MNLAEKFASMVDAAAISGDMTFDSQKALAEYARKYGFAQVFGQACFYPYLLEQLKGTRTGVGGGVGSSLGAGTELTETKVFETKRYVELGCDDIDMWMNISAFRAGMYDMVLEDIKAVRAVTPANHKLKVIIEAPLLSHEEILKACELIIEGGADFVKSGAGYLGACTVEHAKSMMEGAKGKVMVKCAGGIRDVETVKAMMEMGVHRIGMGYGSAEKIIAQLG